MEVDEAYSADILKEENRDVVNPLNYTNLSSPADDNMAGDDMLNDQDMYDPNMQLQFENHMN